VEKNPIQRDVHSPASELLSDDELAALALAADPSAPLDSDAVAWNGAFLHRPGLLPDWYMPTPASARPGRWPRAVVVGLVAGFLLINAFGLCVTSGFISIP
jgi:hypothetical protein